MLISRNRINALQIVFFSVLLLSCSSSRNKNNILTSHAERKDFVDKITVSGVIEAIKTISVSCPGLPTDLTIAYLIPEGTHVMTGDTVCILEGRELENQYNNAVREFEISEAEYTKKVAELALKYLLLESQAKNIEALTAITQLDSLQMKFTSSSSRQIIKLELEKAEVEKNKILNTLKFLKRINDSEMQKMKLEIQQKKNKVDRAKSNLDKLVLTASVEGIIMYFKHWVTETKVRKGDVVWRRFPLVQIPIMNEIQAKLLVNEVHFKQLEKEQKVEVRVDAFPDIQLTGKIKSKAPVGKPIKKDSNVKIFEVVALLDSSAVTIQPGLSITCDVLINMVPDTIIVPVVSIFEEDSTKVVYVASDKMFIKQPVEVALSNSKNAVIRTGLQGNEILALRKPHESLIINNK